MPRKSKKKTKRRQRGGFNWARSLRATRDRGVSGLMNSIQDEIIERIAGKAARQRGGLSHAEKKRREINKKLAPWKRRDDAIKKKLEANRKIVEDPYFQILLNPQRRVNPTKLPGVYNRYTESKIGQKLKNFKRIVRRRKGWDE